MRIGIYSIDRIAKKWGEGALSALKTMGYDAWDYSMTNTESELYACPEEDAFAFLRKEKELAEAAGISIHQVHGPWRWPPQDYEEAERNERLEKMKRSIRMTAALGARYWIVHPLMPFGIEDIGSDKEAETRRINLGFMRELLAQAKKCGVTICLENMPFVKFSIATPAAILDFVKEINDENFRICLDTGHVATFENLNLAEEVLRLGGYIKALHVHDSYTGHDYHNLPYQGKIDWEAFGAALLAIGYEGVFSLETTPSLELPNDLFAEELALLAKKSIYITRDRKNV